MRKLSNTTRAPKRNMTTATPISTALTDAAERCCSLSIPSSIRPSRNPGFWPPRARGVRPILPRQESRFLHEHDVPRLLARHPGLVFLSVQGSLVERPRFEEARPLRGRTHLLQQVHVELDLLGGHPARHENPAQHQVLDVEAGVLARGNVVPGHRLGALRLVWQ